MHSQLLGFLSIEVASSNIQHLTYIQDEHYSFECIEKFLTLFINTLLKLFFFEIIPFTLVSGLFLFVFKFYFLLLANFNVAFAWLYFLFNNKPLPQDSAASYCAILCCCAVLLFFFNEISLLLAFWLWRSYYYSWACAVWCDMLANLTFELLKDLSRWCSLCSIEC